MPTPKGSAAAKKAWETRRTQTEQLPPHALPEEMGALSCVLQAGNSNSQQNVDAMLSQLRPNYFYDHRTRTLHNEMVKMRFSSMAVDLVTLRTWLQNARKPEGQLFDMTDEVGGWDFVDKVVETAPSAVNFPYYLPTLKNFYRRRWLLQTQSSIGELVQRTDLTPDQFDDRCREHFSELYEKTISTGATAPMLHIVSPEQARSFEPDPNDFMLGNGLISRGMFVTIGGEAGVGKSRLATTLAVAGARGNNRWQNYPVRCKWKTLIVQCENSALRLKEDFEAVPKQFNDDIRVTDSLSHGMAFDNVEFRRELRRFYEDWPFEMLVVDPWNKVTSEDGQADYIESLFNIEQCFRGLRMPAVVIVAHLRKRGRDDRGERRTGRELLNELSGSLAIGSSSRTVFVIQAASPSMEDDRIVFEVAKANDCKGEWLREFGSRSAWKRANGAFESIDNFDWAEFESPGDPERRKVTEDMVRTVFEGEKEIKPALLAKKLKSVYHVGESTAFRAIGEDGYLRAMLQRTPTGRLQLRNGD